MLDDNILIFKENPKRTHQYKEFHDIVKHRIIHAVISHLNLSEEKKLESDLVSIEITKDNAIKLINDDNFSGLVPKNTDQYRDKLQLIKPKIDGEYDNLEYFQAIVDYSPGDDYLKIFTLDIPDSIVILIVKGLMDWYMQSMKTPVN